MTNEIYARYAISYNPANRDQVMAQLDGLGLEPVSGPGKRCVAVNIPIRLVEKVRELNGVTKVKIDGQRGLDNAKFQERAARALGTLDTVI